jgi:endonuclease-3
MLTKKRRAALITERLKNEYGTLECFLRHKDCFELICAVILSAQCTDERVNMVTPGLFKRFPDARALSQAELSEVETLIKSCGFYRNKAKNLIKMARSVVELHGGEVPNDMDALVKLAGVGRKTANVVLGTWYANSSGVVVDTHVKRITNLLGLTKNSDPVKIEQDLNKIVEREHWDQFSLWLIALGRETCIARRPQCEVCLLKDLCKAGSKV